MAVLLSVSLGGDETAQPSSVVTDPLSGGATHGGGSDGSGSQVASTFLPASGGPESGERILPSPDHGLPSGQAALEALASVQSGPVAHSVAAPPSVPAPTGAAAAARRYGQSSSLHFEPNRGQTSAGVQFLARGKGFNLSLTSTEAVYVLQKPLRPVGAPLTAPATTRAVLRLQLVGANPQVQAQGLDLQPGRSNYIRGADRQQWLRNIENYGRVLYSNIYPGISLVYYGGGSTRQQVEYDFAVSPGANPNTIRMAHQGVTARRIDALGRLILTTPAGDVVQRAPVLYQLQGGVRQSRAGRYVLHSGNQVGFEVVGGYDPSRTLYIDPIVDYAGAFGGSGDDSAEGIAVTSDGTVYLTGTTTSDDLPGPGEFTYTDGTDAFVMRLAPDGTPLYTTYLGGINDDFGRAIALGPAGVYVAGMTSSPDFPPSPSSVPFQARLLGPSDAFAAVLNPVDLTLSYATYLGGEKSEEATSIAIDGTGAAYLTGWSDSSLFPTPNGFQVAPGLGKDAIVARLGPTLSTLGYGSYLGGEGEEQGRGIAVDGTGAAYVTGWSSSLLFPTTPGAYREGPLGATDAFVTKVSYSGSAMVYSTRLGGRLDDQAHAITLDESGNAFITGVTASIDFETSEDALQPQNLGGDDAFVTRLAADGASIIYSSYLGGGGNDEGRAIVADLYGRAYITGSTSSADLLTTGDALQPTPGGVDPILNIRDIFIAEVGVAGTSLIYLSYLGGIDNDEGLGIALDGLENLYTAGLTSSEDFPAEGAFFGAQPPANQNAFVARQGFPQVNVINVIPNVAGSRFSHESNQDSEPSIAVNPADPLKMAITTFSRINGGPWFGPPSTAWTQDNGIAPLWVSTNGGQTWNMRPHIPHGDTGVVHGPRDQTLAYNSNGSLLYGVFGGGPEAISNKLYFGTTGNPDTTNLNVSPHYVSVATVDQAWVHVTRVDNLDRVYLSFNDYNSLPNSATILVRRPGTGILPTQFQIDGGAPVGSNGPPVRVAINGDKVYAAFVRPTAVAAGNKVAAQIVVVRDDMAGFQSETNPNPFRALGVAGRTVESGDFPTGAFMLGQERLGSDLSIAVDPGNPNKVYVAYVRINVNNKPEIHVRVSDNAGVNWSGNIIQIVDAGLPALAVSANRTLGLLYTRLTVDNRMSTEFMRVRDILTPEERRNTTVLTRWTLVPPLVPAVQFQPYIGDYQQVVAIGDRFYGAYSASNEARLVNFPDNGAFYQRYVRYPGPFLRSHFRLHQTIGSLDNGFGQSPGISIDPYFFTAPAFG